MWKVFKFIHFTLFWTAHKHTMFKLISHSTQHIILPNCIHFNKYCSIQILFTFFIPPTSNHFPHTFCQRHIQVLRSKNSKRGSTVNTFEEIPYALSAPQEGCNLRTSKYYIHPQNYKWNPETQLGSSELLKHHCNKFPLPIQHYETSLFFHINTPVFTIDIKDNKHTYLKINVLKHAESEKLETTPRPWLEGDKNTLFGCDLTA